MKNILVTGAAGFIGRNLISELCKKYYVYALVLPSEECKMELSDNCSLVVGNLEDIDTLVEQLGKIEISVIFHLAWIGVSTDLKNDISIQMKNIIMAQNVMEMSKRIGCNRVISTGSVSEYAYVGERVNGSQVPAPCDLYSLTKVSVHLLCDLFARKNNMSFNWVLIPSIYGPGRDDNNIITYTIKTLLKKQKPSFTKLEQKWDYIYISDLIASLILVYEKGKENVTYVTGSGMERELSEYIKMIHKKIDSSLPIGIGELSYKTKQIDNSIVTIEKLQTDTGYKPKVTFEEGIDETINYYKGKIHEM